MDSPLKKVAVSGKLDTNKPYSLRLQSVFDDRDVMTSDLEVNPSTGRFQFSSNYDRGEWELPGPPSRSTGMRCEDVSCSLKEWLSFLLKVSWRIMKLTLT